MSVRRARVAAVTATTPRLLLLDGHSLAYRAFFALPVENFSTTTGQPTNAVYGFTSMLINVLRDEQPTHIVVAFDVSRQSFRTEQVRGVQGQPQPRRPTDFKGQVSLVKEVLDALRIPVVEKEGYEADDVIATLARQARDAGHGGADLHRRPRRVPAGHRPRHGALPEARASPSWPGWTPAAVEPSGTASAPSTTATSPPWSASPATTCPACPGVGDEDRRQVDQRSSATSTASSPTSTRSRARPATACASTWPRCCATTSSTGSSTTSSCRCAPSDAAWHGWDREAVHQVFDTLQFRVLRDRLYQYLEAVEPGGRGRLRPRPARSCGDRARSPAWLDRARAGRHAGRRGRQPARSAAAPAR